MEKITNGRSFRSEIKKLNSRISDIDKEATPMEYKEILKIIDRLLEFALSLSVTGASNEHIQIILGIELRLRNKLELLS